MEDIFVTTFYKKILLSKDDEKVGKVVLSQSYYEKFTAAIDCAIGKAKKDNRIDSLTKDKMELVDDFVNDGSCAKVKCINANSNNDSEYYFSVEKKMIHWRYT